LNDAHTFGQKMGFREKQALEAEWMADRQEDGALIIKDEVLNLLLF
jgi:hypothetical protein